MNASLSLPLRTVVLVEPICRGSRLQILSNTLSALAGSAEVIVVTRRDYRDTHFDELIESKGLHPRIIAADTDLDGAWMRNLSRVEFGVFFAELLKLDQELTATGNYDLVFMALDDYLLAYVLHSVVVRRHLRRARISCMKYRVEYLFKLTVGYRFRGLTLRLLTRGALALSRAKLICFDERMADHWPSNSVTVVPDPWFGPFSSAYRSIGRTKLGVSESDFVLLTIGKQDRRKGIDFLIRAFPALASDATVKLAVVGEIAKEFTATFDHLVRSYPSQVLHIDAFVPEADLPAYFAAADAFLLPYRLDFTATSGTLARAAASGVQVIATSHGLVGYRVHTYELGATYTAEDIASFREALATVRNRASLQNRAILAHCRKFAEQCSLPRFETAIRSALSK